MRVHVKLEDNRRFVIPVPLSIVNMGLSIANMEMVKKYVPKDQLKYLDAVDFHALKRGISNLRDYKGLKLVEVRNDKGVEVMVVL